MPGSLAILRAKAFQIALSLGVFNFSASNGYLQRSDSVNMVLHETGASTNAEEAAERMAEIKRLITGVDPKIG